MVVMVGVLPNANIPPATAQSGSPVASYHTAAGRQQRQCRQPSVLRRLPAGPCSEGGRALMPGLSRSSEGSRRKDESREASCTTTHHQPARYRGLIQFSRTWNKHTMPKPTQHPGLKYFHTSNETVFNISPCGFLK